MNRKVISVVVALAMLLSLFSISFAATDSTMIATNQGTFKDVNGHWASEAIYKWSGYGVISGYGGFFRPNDSITRGEMACILNNIMDYQTAAKNTFTDVKGGKFYTDAVLKANAAGIMTGDGVKLLRPTDKITREEAAVMLARAFAVNGGNSSDTKFKDAATVSSFAKASVFGLEAKGYISGINGKYNPKVNITRAETITIINNIVKGYYTEAGTYTDNVAGTAVIKVPNVILKGITISENLIIAEGVGKGNATLDSVIVKGNTVVRGGGENSIHIVGTSNITNIRIETIGDKLRIMVSEGNTVKEIEIAKGEEIIITGTVGAVDIAASNATVYATGANISSANITGSNSTIMVDNESMIGPVSINSTAENTVIKTEKGAVVGTVTAAARTAISGEGAVASVVLNSGANNSSVSTPNTQTTVAGGVIGATGGGGAAIPAGSSATNNSTGNGLVSGAPASSGSTPSNPTQIVAITGISVTADAITVVNENTLQMSAAVTPVNATNKTISWSVSTLAGGSATISQAGLLTATRVGTVRVTATNTASGVVGFKDITILAPINNYTALGDSIAYGMSAVPGKGYTNLFYDNLKTINGNEGIKLINLGVPGEKSADLLNKLQNDTATIDSVSKAKVITISVGGNNLLSPVIGSLATAFNLSPSSVSFANDLAVAIAKKENQPILNTVIAGPQNALTSGVVQFSTDWVNIIGTIKALAPQAQVYVTTLYNPFNINDGPLYSIFDNAIKGMNAIISIPNAGYKVADVYTAFNSYTDTDPLLSFSMIAGKLDPHPTTKGHEVIYQAHLNAKEIEVVAITDISVTSATTVTFKSDATPTTVIWNGTEVVSSMIGTNPYIITVPKITKTQNALIVNAAGYGAKTVPVTILGSIDNLKLITNASELANAIVNQADGQSWIIKAGTYDLIQTELDKYKANRYDANGLVTAATGGQTGWYFPITANNLVITGEGSPVITSSVYSANGNWSTQNFITVWGDDVTIEGINLDSIAETNKVIEILGKNFKLKDDVFLENSKGTSGCIYFNPNNTTGQTKDMGDIILEDIDIQKGDISYRDNAWGSGAMSGTLLLKNVTIDNREYGIPFNYGAIVNPSNSNNGITSDQLIVTAENLKIKLDNLACDLPHLNDFFAILKTGTTVELAAGTYYVPETLHVPTGVILDTTTNGAIVEVMPQGTVLVGNVTELINALSGSATTIRMAAGVYELDSQIRINKDINIIGAGDSTVITKGSAPWTNSSGSKGYAPLITIASGSNTVKLENIKVTGAANIVMTDPGSGTDYGSGINVVSSSNVTLNNVTSTSNAAAGLIVNSSTVAAINLNTSGNGWYGINVDQKDSGPASFTLTGSGVIAESKQILADKTNGVTIIADGYTAYKLEGTDVTIWNNKSLINVASITTGSITKYYPTIQAAVTAANPGETINVAAGTYNESIEITKPIKLIGAGADKTILNAANNSIWYVLSLGRAGVYGDDLSGTVIDGFTINAPTVDTGDKAPIYLTAQGSTDNKIVIRNNVFVGQPRTATQQGIGILTPYDSNIGNVEITNNEFSTLKYAMYFNSLRDASISGNTVDDTKYAGIVIAGDSAITSKNITITNNTLTNISWKLKAEYSNPEYDSGICVGSNVEDIRISDNSISMLNDKLQIHYSKSVSNEADLKAALANPIINTINITANFTTTEKINVNRPVIINGGGKTITVSEDLETDNSSKHALGIQANNITIRDLTIDSAFKAYGVQAYICEAVILENVTITNSKGAGLTVNGSNVTATNLNTTGNLWGGVNVDPGSGVDSPSMLTLNSGILAEPLQIWSDGEHVSATAAVSVTASGYTQSTYTPAGAVADSGKIWTNRTIESLTSDAIINF